jgi:single-strand DNA-binding protein
MNVHTIHGRLTRAPELTKGDEQNKDRVNFTVAVDRRFGDETDFFDVVMFGKRAGVIAKYFGKGAEIAVTGEGQIRTYEGKDGVKRKAYSIVASEFDFCGPKRTESSETASDEVWTAQEEDIPF